MLFHSRSHIWEVCLVPYIFITLVGLSLGSSLSFECQLGILLLYMVKGARERCAWKICCKFTLVRGGKSVNLKLAHKIQLSWINLQHSPLGDVLNDVLFKACLLFSRTCCSAAYSKLWPTGFLLPYPKPPLITLLDYSPPIAQAGLRFDELIAELLEKWVIKRLKAFLWFCDSSQIQKYDSRMGNTTAFHGGAPWDALGPFPDKVDAEAYAIKWLYFFIVGH